jgi:hypothetical protein
MAAQHTIPMPKGSFGMYTGGCRNLIPMNPPWQPGEASARRREDKRLRLRPLDTKGLRTPEVLMTGILRQRGSHDGRP